MTKAYSVSGFRRRQLGFTLIELMITITILSLLLFTGSYSYSLMSERWNKELGQFSESSQRAKHLEVLQRLLEGVQSFVVVDDKQIPSLFFIGDQDSLLAVSRAGLFSGEFPEVFRLTTVKKEDGLVDLVYQSASTQNFLLTGTEQEIDFSKQLTLFTDLDKVSFSYLGWASLDQKTAARDSGASPSWRARYSGIDSQLMPDILVLNLVMSGKELSFPVYLEANPEHWLSPYFSDFE